MSRKVYELLFIGLMVSVLMQFMHKDEPTETQTASQNPTEISKTKVSPEAWPIAVGAVVPDFRMKDPSGAEVVHQAGQGPLFISLTATGCGDCLRRIDAEDAIAYELAAKVQVPVWNMLVFHPQNSAQSFVDKNHPSADLVLADASSEVSVKMLGGSDASCWMVVDRSGRLIHRGPAQLEQLEEALGSI